MKVSGSRFFDGGPHTINQALRDAVEHAITHEEAPTDRCLFGSWGTFRRNVLKTVRKRAL